MSEKWYVGDSDGEWGPFPSKEAAEQWSAGQFYPVDQADPVIYQK